MNRQSSSVQRYPAGILRNTVTGRFHPILFRPGPAPSESATDHAHRYKSRGHHTEGFDTHDEALAFVNSREDWKWSGREWEWDGDDVPAMVEWFGTEDTE